MPPRIAGIAQEVGGILSDIAIYFVLIFLSLTSDNEELIGKLHLKLHVKARFRLLHYCADG